MSLIIAGRPGAREVALTTRRSREGRDIIRTIVGPAADVFAIEANMYAGGATEVNTVQQVGSPLATMTVKYSYKGADAAEEENEEDGQDIVEEVRLDYNKTPIPIKQNQYFADLAIDGIITVDDAVENKQPFPAGGDGINDDPRWEDYYLLTRLGTKEWECELPSVKYSIKCSPTYAGILETDSVGIVFSKAHMLERISAPKFFTITEPPELALSNAYGYFYTGWRLTASVSFDKDGGGILEEVYTWGHFAKQLHSFSFEIDY